MSFIPGRGVATELIEGISDDDGEMVAGIAALSRRGAAAVPLLPLPEGG